MITAGKMVLRARAFSSQATRARTGASTVCRVHQGVVSITSLLDSPLWEGMTATGWHISVASTPRLGPEGAKAFRGPATGFIGAFPHQPSSAISMGKTAAG